MPGRPDIRAANTSRGTSMSDPNVRTRRPDHRPADKKTKAVDRQWQARLAEVVAAVAGADAEGLIAGIAAGIQSGEMARAADLFRQAAQVLTLTDLVVAVGQTALPAARTITWGPAPYVFANPLREDWVWRCGDCRMTGSNFRTSTSARRDAAQHRDEDHPGAQLIRLGA